MSQEHAEPRRVGCLGRTLYIVLVVLLILGFAGGAVYFLWYQPVARENQSMKAELEKLRPLQGENDDLRAQVGQAAVRLLVLRALVDTNAARASLALGKPDQGTDSLTSAGSWLEQLAGSVSSADATDVGQMRDRLGLALAEVHTDAFAAQSDLDVLANDLAQLADKLAGQ